MRSLNGFSCSGSQTRWTNCSHSTSSSVSHSRDFAVSCGGTYSSAGVCVCGGGGGGGLGCVYMFVRQSLCVFVCMCTCVSVHLCICVCVYVKTGSQYNATRGHS